MMKLTKKEQRNRELRKERLTYENLKAVQHDPESLIFGDNKGLYTSIFNSYVEETG